MKNIIKKWYSKLSFPESWDERFYELLERTELFPCDIEDYDHSVDFEKNLLMFLYFCEDLRREYEEKGIEEKYLMDTLADIVIWAKTHYDVHARLGLSETSWLKRHLTMKLIKLGRLQFCMAPAEHGTPDGRIKRGENVLEIHICAGEKLDRDECLKSIDAAKVFFAKYFPEFSYRYFTCHSWLLDSKLRDFLSERSNMLKFQSLFEVVCEDESYAILKYVFRWDTTKVNLASASCTSSFAEKVKEYVENGGVFHESLGIIKK